MLLQPTSTIELPWRGGVVRTGPAPLLMGILNVTPDSFSDGGLYLDPDRAAAHARKMVEEGADVIDIGGESTRPGANRVSAPEQIDRLVPVLRRLGDLGKPVSVDTTVAEVAAAALDAGADWINDVSALTGDSEMGPLAAERDCPVVLMHMRGAPSTMQRDVSYTDVVSEVLDYLIDRGGEAEAIGIRRSNVIVDPGIGFGKSPDQNLALLRSVPTLVDAGYPVLIGASRKSFLGACFAQEPEDRLEGSVAAALAAVAGGAHVVRVHDVASTRRAVDVYCGIAAAG